MVKIRNIRAAGLRGRTPEGGWSRELQPDDCVHTLIVVDTTEGLRGDSVAKLRNEDLLL
jgi:D-galactarolactone cycloisomerase